MPPLLYYIRHGETDWNREGRLQGQRDIPINAHGRAQARRCGEILRDLFARDAPRPGAVRFRRKPARARARDDGTRAHNARARSDGLSAWTRASSEVSFGRWEGFTTDELAPRFPDAVAARERDKWDFTPPAGGKLRDDVAAHARMVRRADARHGRGRAWRARCAGLIVQLGIASAEEAPFLDVAQGVVYAIRPGSIARYA